MKTATTSAYWIQVTLACLQLVAVGWLVRTYHIEENSGIGEVVYPILGAAMAHFVLPKPFRNWLSIALTIGIALYAFGWLTGMIFTLSLLGVIAIALLPINYWLRVVLLLGVGSCMVLLRSEWIYAPRMQLIVPFLASVFMFRLVLYMHEDKHGLKDVPISEKLAYFFMFPNLCFLLFPVVDLRTFISTYKPGNLEVVQKGIRALIRGCLHIVLYRVIYYYLLPSPLEVRDVSDLFEFIVFTYMLILRLSGIFHLCVGFLQIFGRDLPPVFNNYFLAAGPSDIWRRINIYWTQFMTKVVYYPVFFRFKKKGQLIALIMATLVVFIITWFLHSYQWYWLQGVYPFSINDVGFWLFFGLAIMINTVIQDRKTRKKRLSIKVFQWSGALKKAGLVSITFFGMATLWSFWTSQTPEDWWFLMTQGGLGTSSDYVQVLAVVLIVFLGLILREWMLAGGWHKWTEELRYQSNLVISLIGIGLLFGAYGLSQQTGFDHQAELSDLQTDRLNQWDREVTERGYYEGLLGNNAPRMWEMQIDAPHNGEYDRLTNRVSGILIKELKPNIRTVFKGKELNTNRFGMRDQDYSLEKPAGITRMALLGGSYELGAGVADDEVFEHLVEEDARLQGRYEILNFGVSGYNLPQVLRVMETKTARFEPDYIILAAHTEESRRWSDEMARLVKHGRFLDYEVYEQIKRKSGARQSMGNLELRRRLEPYGREGVKWTYQRIGKLAQEMDAKVIWLHLPTTDSPMSDREKAWLIDLATQLDFTIVDLGDLWEGRDLSLLTLSKSDGHPNGNGHRIIADRLFESLVETGILTIPKSP